MIYRLLDTMQARARGEEMDKPICKGCKQVTHPAYTYRYGGYCLDCSNQGVPGLHEEIDGLQGEARQSQQRIAQLETEIWALERENDALREQIKPAQGGKR